ncbi:MAG: AbrB family transcriptional regulator [Rudaea sp.]|uniref:AbrB family transcriptional regulator n=1 Tax=unclassified Rudaea TaxID=2627037 RepID=UPI0010F87C06|nr:MULTISPECIES: AbrB family transcriptional regulator [unclassified Rudaea]MBN8887738.1 AbrB family transcriptional regulator [Rudaea sp.]MBR0346582.1 AbrB family transcriptional regulator [Rudaea sp.]
MLARLSKPAQWGLLAILSAAIAGGLFALHLPGALLLGPMFAGIAFGTHGAEVRVPAKAYIGAQAIVGCLIANMITPAIAQTFLAHWPLFVGTIAATLVASIALGAGLSRVARTLPGTTAIWGVTPGAAMAMVLMAESFGADARLVAFMQYLRVICVALVAAAVAHFWLHLQDVAPVQPVWFPPLDVMAFAGTLAVAAIGAVVGVRSRIQAGALLVPALGAIVLHLGGWLKLELPPWLLTAVYALIGWSIGLRFRRDTLRYSLRALSPILFSIAALIAVCAGLSWLLVQAAGVDALTAYLAMSPGGMDTVAIIAASSHVDLAFVMAMQAVRLIVVIALGPRLAAWVARHIGKQSAAAIPAHDAATREDSQ